MRCTHGFFGQLCVIPTCPNFDGGEPSAEPAAQRAAAAPGAGARVRAALTEMPLATNTEIARRCGCSTSLVSAVRAALGLQRRKGAGRPFKQP